MDLAREILFAVEKMPYVGVGRPLELPDRDADAVNYHIWLLNDAQLILATSIGGHARDSVPTWRPVTLTWAGHEFLDAARDEGMWKRTTAMVRDKTGGIGFEVLKAVLIQLGKTAVLGEPSP